MNISIKFINAIFIVALVLNSYKIFLTPLKPYNIFPWSPISSPAQSSPFWLTYHWGTAMMLLFAAWNWHSCLTRSTSRNLIDSYKYILLSHVLFLIGIIPNIFHLGSFNPYMALVINGGTCIALTWCLYRSQSLLYFMILNIPVFAELLYLVGYLIL